MFYLSSQIWLLSQWRGRASSKLLSMIGDPHLENHVIPLHMKLKHVQSHLITKPQPLIHYVEGGVILWKLLYLYVVISIPLLWHTPPSPPPLKAPTTSNWHEYPYHQPFPQLPSPRLKNLPFLAWIKLIRHACKILRRIISPTFLLTKVKIQHHLTPK